MLFHFCNIYIFHIETTRKSNKIIITKGASRPFFYMNRFMGNKPFNPYSGYIRSEFGSRVQKISIDAGFTCPNRDGTKSTGGCVYCDNKTFSQEYCNSEKSITDQLNQGIAFFRDKYKTQKYIAYFQAYSNTYAPPEKLQALYEEALSHPRVTGLAIGTRPDCIDDDTLACIRGFSRKHHTVIEYGVESFDNNVLQNINRCHTFQDAIYAVEKTAEYGIMCGIHLLFGLPGEKEGYIGKTAKTVSQLPVKFLKTHQLQIIRGTKMEAWYRKNPELFRFYTVDEYIDLIISFLERLNPEIVIERFISESPPEKICNPRWGIKNHEFVNKLTNRMQKKSTWQGKNY